MPYWAELENEGLVQLADPAVTGGVGAGLLGDGVGFPPEVGAWLADAEAEAEAEADAERDADAEAWAVCDARDRGFGMTATRGVAAAWGIPAAATLSVPAPAVAWKETPASAAAPAI
jgi:hypothetical protein